MLPLSFVRFRFRLLTTQPLLFPFLPSAVSAMQLGFLSFSGLLSLSCFSSSFQPCFPCFPSDSKYSAFCSFPFVLPCFAPTAVPQVLPFWISPPGSVPDFRFLSSTSVLASSLLSLLFFLFHSLPVFASQLAIPVLLFRFRFPGFSPSSRPGFPCLLFRFYVLGFLYVSFRPSLFRSHSCSTGAHHFPSFDFPLVFPLASTFFRPLRFRFRLLSLCFFLSLFPSSPSQWVIRCAYPLFVPPVSMLPIKFWYSAFLQFLSPLTVFASQVLLQSPASCFQIGRPLSFRLRIRLLGRVIHPEN